MAQFFVRCCLICAYWLTSSARVSGLSDVIEYRITEGQPANTLIGNVPVDAGLHTMYTAQTLTSFRYRLLPTDSDTDRGVNMCVVTYDHNAATIRCKGALGYVASSLFFR